MVAVLSLSTSVVYAEQTTSTALLTHGADRCLRDHKGNTALMGAIFKLEWSIANQLRQVDCDVQAKQTGQKTVREFAKVIGQEQQLEKWIETESQQE